MKPPLKTPYVAAACRAPGLVPALQGAQCPRWDESLGHTRRGTPTSQLTCSPPALAPFCVSRKPPEVTRPSTAAAGHGRLLKSQLGKMKLLKKSAPQPAPFPVLSGLAAKKPPWPSHLCGHPGPVPATRNSAPSLSPREAPDLLGAEGPETRGPRVGTGPPEIAEGEPWGPLAPQPCPPRMKQVQTGRGAGGAGGWGWLRVPFPGFSSKGMVPFHYPRCPHTPPLLPRQVSTHG